MFSCDFCGDALCEYDVTLTIGEAELCDECLAESEQQGLVIMATRFVGLSPRVAKHG